MTAMDVFVSYLRRGEQIEALEEKIRRREAVMTGGTARPSEPDGGSRGTDDASMRLLDYVGNIESLRKELSACQQAREEDKDCALYLTEMLPDPLGGVMMRIYVEDKSYREIADEIGYSVSHVKRLRRDAEKLCQSIRVVSWDRRHVPVLVFPASMGGL